MLKGIFDLDSPIMRFLTLVANIVILNLLFLICSIPIVTVGASLTGLYSVTLKMIRNEEGSIAAGFFKGMKENFKQATIIWLILLAVAGILYVDYRAVQILGGDLSRIFRYIFMVILLLYGFLVAYVFPVLAMFENTIKNTIKNAFLMSISHLPYSILILLVWAAPVVFFGKIMVISPLVPLLFLTGFGLVAYISSWCFRKVFDRFLPEECNEIQEDEL